VDFDSKFGFKISGDQSPKKVGCSHLALLPTMPDFEQLKAMRKGLRKQKRPEIISLTVGGHDQIGNFEFDHKGETTMVRWNLVGKPEKCVAFEQLCINPDYELDRLELGWMIANMAKLDEMHKLEDAEGIPHPIYYMEEISRISRYFNKIENRWRHWAIVPAGHMLAS
jgi:hypothetical protein